MSHTEKQYILNGSNTLKTSSLQ